MCTYCCEWLTRRRCQSPLVCFSLRKQERWRRISGWIRWINSRCCSQCGFFHRLIFPLQKTASFSRKWRRSGPFPDYPPHTHTHIHNPHRTSNLHVALSTSHPLTCQHPADHVDPLSSLFQFFLKSLYSFWIKVLGEGRGGGRMLLSIL